MKKKYPNQITTCTFLGICHLLSSKSSKKCVQTNEQTKKTILTGNNSFYIIKIVTFFHSDILSMKSAELTDNFSDHKISYISSSRNFFSLLISFNGDVIQCLSLVTNIHAAMNKSVVFTTYF